MFSEEKPGEWEVVIEYNQVENLYFIYGTMDSGSFNGKHV
ncbi:Imm59 family immunity protein [Streptococcus sanguinis]|nr:Imm59 family immunity protein [Streptococcus sanguinis]